MTKPKTPKIVVVAILTVVTVVFWIGFGVYRIITAEPEIDVPREILLPLNPNLDVASLNELQSRLYLSEEEIGERVVVSTAPTASPESEATSSAEE